MISITLPSLDMGRLRHAMRNLAAATRTPYELIVVAPAPLRYADVEQNMPQGCRLVWIEEQKRGGPNAAHARAYREATGQFVMPWVDDHYLVNGWDRHALRSWWDLRPNPREPFVLGLRHAIEPHVGTVFGHYYPYFPFLPRTLGRYITDEFRTGFGDCDFALDIWRAGGRCSWTDVGLVIKGQADDRKLPDLIDGAHTTPDDTRRFIEKWVPHYGGSQWDTSHLRGFNIDVCPEEALPFPAARIDRNSISAG